MGEASKLGVKLSVWVKLEQCVGGVKCGCTLHGCSVYIIFMSQPLVLQLLASALTP